MNSVKRLIVATLLGFVTVAIAGLLVVGWFLARPAGEGVGAPPPDLGAENVSIPGGSSGSVRGWFAAGRPGVGAVLLLHPVRANRTAMIGRARFLHRQGYGILLVDLQAHGETPGRHITFGARESLDAATALTYLQARAPGERLGVIGVSLGGAAALLGRGPLKVDAIVLEAVYPTVAEATADRLRIRLGAVGAAMAPLLTWQLRMWTGISAAELRPIDAIHELQAPLLLIAGSEDPRTTLAESERLFAAAPSPKEMWVVTHAVHEDFYATRRDAYEARVGDFLRRYLHSEH